MMLAVVYVSVLLAVVEMASVDLESVKPVEKRASSVCFDKLGCFTTNHPFAAADRILTLLPHSPDAIGTKYHLYSHEAPNGAQNVDARHPETAATVWTHFHKRPTKLIVHGFLDNPETGDWMKTIKDELLKHGDYNVIIVDWHGGNTPPYTQATANTRVVGAQMAELIKTLSSSKGVPVADFHIIGHSLGAHIAGYAGERVPGLGRITGLDPAGPYFDNTDKAVRLDPSDAVFVDVIHSDAKNLLHLGFGMREAVGHADFFPNLGHDQPGCNKSPITQIAENGLIDGVTEVVSCNHMRAIKLFTESINTHCPYEAFPCASEEDFTNNKCRACTAAGCSKMGFNAQKHGAHQTKYFLTTAGHTPFCEYHMDFMVKFTAGKGIEERGTFHATVHGTKGSTGAIPLTPSNSPIMVKSGGSYHFYVGAPMDIGTVQSVTFSWQHDSSFLHPSSWNLLGLRHPTVFIDDIDVHTEETNAHAHFCAGGKAVETATTLSLATKC